MADTPKLDLSTVGATGLPVWSGRVYDEILPVLQGDRGRRILREMSEQDPIIGGVLLGIEMLARQVPWSMTPADESQKAKDVADFVDEALTDMVPTFGNSMSEILSMLVYGWSWLEIIYKRRQGLDVNSPMKSSRFDDDKVGWAGWAIRSQETLYTWEWSGGTEGKGELTSMTQMPPPSYDTLTIPRSKSLHFKTRSRRENPEGISILRNCYRPWFFKNNIEKIEGIGIERDLAGLPILWAPQELFSQDATAEQKALFEQLKKIVGSIKRDEQEGIVMPMAFDEDGKNPIYKLELLSTGGDRQFDTNGIINRYDERIAMSMLADFILMGHQAVGSFALSTTKTGLFTTALSAIMDVIQEEINSQAIPRLVLLNGWDLKYVPTLQHGKIEASDLSKLGEFLKQLSDAGMALFPNEALEAYLLKQAGLPADPGAGELPMPVDAEGNPLTNDDGTPLDPAALAAAAQAQAAGAPPPTPAARVLPVANKKPAAKPVKAVATTTRTAHEASTHHRHFTPLAVRVAKLQKPLTDQMDPEEYRGLLEQVMSAGKFTKLDKKYQDAITKAEAV